METAKAKSQGKAERGAMRRSKLVYVALAMCIAAVGIGATLASATDTPFSLETGGGTRDCAGNAQITVTVTGDDSQLVVNGGGFPAQGVDVTDIVVSTSGSPFTVSFKVPDTVPKTAVTGFMSFTVGTHNVPGQGFQLPAVDCVPPTTPPTTPPATNPPSTNPPGGSLGPATTVTPAPKPAPRLPAVGTAKTS
jgi:hypothetical protein